MGYESSHRQVRDELALELAHVHQLQLAQARELVKRAEQLASDDPAQRSVRQWFAIVLERVGSPVIAPEHVPGRESLVTRAEREPEAEESVATPARPEPLEAAIRARMEAAFGVGFGAISVFRNSPLARGAVRALATSDAIHFRSGAYQPGTAAGDRLIAHELAHVVQHRSVPNARAGARVEIEREADRAAGLAARGMAAPIALRAQPGTAYAFSDDDDHDHDDAERDTTPKVDERWLSTLAGSIGQRLPARLQKQLEQELGTDLSDVRVHDGPLSDAAAREIDARAFTIGRDIHFAQGLYNPRTAKGVELIAHEVAHAVQAGAGAKGDGKEAKISTPGDTRELEAERFASEFVKRHGEQMDRGTVGGGARGGTAAKGARAPRMTGASSMIVAGSVTQPIVHRDGGDGPAAPPTPKETKGKPKDPGKPDINEGELKKKNKEANDPEQDKKDKAKYEKDNPKAPKDPDPVAPPKKDTPKVEKPKPIDKKGGDAPPKKGGKGEKTELKPPPKAAKPKAPTKQAPPKQSAAEAAVCAAADNDVKKFWATSKKDEKGAKEISTRSAQIWASAQALGPAAEPDDMIGALNPVTAVYNDGFGKSDLGQAWAGLDQSQSPYALFNDKYKRIAMNVARVRDVAFNLSNVLGKIGLVLTVVGFILSLFGVGAILVTIGRIISVINIILDAVAAVAGIILACITAAQIKEETDPYKKAKLAKLIVADVNKAASNVVNVVLAGNKVGKVIGKGVRAVVKVVGIIVKPIAKAIGKVYAAISKFFTNLSKAKGLKGKIGKAFVATEKGVGGLVNKAKTNRNKVLAEVDRRDTANAQEKAQEKAAAAEKKANARQKKKADAEAAAAKAEQQKLAADNDLATKKTDAGTKKTELDEAKTKAETKKTELDEAKGAQKKSKTDSKAADADAKAKQAAEQKAQQAQTKADAEAKQQAAQAKAADDAAKVATEQRVAKEAAEARAKAAVDRATKAEKDAAEAAAKAKEAADKAKATAGGDAATAQKAADDAQKAATDAQKAADDVVTAQREAQQAKASAEAAAGREQALADAQKKAADQADAAKTAKQEADAAATKAKEDAAKAQADANKAQADAANAQKAEAEAAAAKTEQAKADAAKQAADQAAARKIEADRAAKKAADDARTAAEQKKAADKAAADKLDAERKAVEQQQLADKAKADAAKAKTEADAAAAKSKAEADAAATKQKELDDKVKADQAEVARRKAELEKAEAARAEQVAKENADKAKAAEAAKKAEQAATAKQAADDKLAADREAAAKAADNAKAKKQEWEQKQKDTETAKQNKADADKAAADAKEASKKADSAQKDAQKAADDAKTGQSDAEAKAKEADTKAKEADAAKEAADIKKREAEAAAKQADEHAKQAEAHTKASGKFGQNDAGPMPETPNRIADDMSGENIQQGMGGYAVGQWQQELATKNDPMDNSGLTQLNPWHVAPRAPRMSELRASSPRNISISESVSKIFAKKKEEPAATPAAPAAPAPSAAPAAAPEQKQDQGPLDVGELPYWPELVQTYNFDLSAMGEARSQVAAYKASQQAAVQTAKNDLKKRAAEIRAESKARKAPVKQNEAGLNKDQANLDESKTGNQKQIDNENKSDEEKAKADGPAGEGADAAERAAAAEPPPAKGWWGRIKAIANRFLKATLGRAMKFVTDAITSIVLAGIKQFMGVDVKELANHGMTTADQGKDKAAEGTADTQKAGSGNDQVESDIAQEDMTLGQRIAAGEKNLKDADALEQTIDAQEKALQAEIKACQDFVKQIEAMFAKCKADAEKQQDQPADAPEQQPGPEATTPTENDKTEDKDMEVQLTEARGICTGSIETEIASLNALNAKGASILVDDAGGEPAAAAEAERLTSTIENGVLKSAIGSLEALRGKVASAKDEQSMVAAAEEIEAACESGKDELIEAYVSAENDVLAKPPAPPAGADAPSP